jgi:hypothetical protein
MKNGRELIITRHAVASYSRRLNDERSLRLLANADWNPDVVRKTYGREEVDRLLDFYFQLEREIATCVGYGLEHGLAATHKPQGFVLYGRKSNALPDGQRFVRCEEDSAFGFIVQRDPSGKDVVMTTISRAGVRR